MFRSTRNKKLKIDFWQSLVQGMAADGGLLVPEVLEPLPVKLLKDKVWWSKLTPSDISALLLGQFVPPNDITKSDLKVMMNRAHDFDLPLEKIGFDWVLRLDQGPTASFKDIAARALAELLECYSNKFNQSLDIIVATSGDTGVAVADAFGRSKHIRVTVLYPSYGVSVVQEKQMLHIHKLYENEQVIPIDGNFDQCQDVAKAIQAARGKKDVLGQTIGQINVSSANSINIWRLIPQMTQYFVSYAALVKKGEIDPGAEIVFAVPTGNVGHLMAGVYARELGLPVKKFIVGTNANNILANIVGSGVIKHRGFVETSAPSMDILDPSNLERLLDFAATKIGLTKALDFAGIKRAIKSAGDQKSIDLKPYGVTDKLLNYLQTLIWVEDVETDEEITAAMCLAAAKHKIVLEPHGATAYIATARARAKKVIGKNDQVVIFETAHPTKFPNALNLAVINSKIVHQHHVLKKLIKMDLKDFKKPKTEDPDPLMVARRMVELGV